MGKKHVSPSREKYEKNHPNWTVRMPLQWHEDYKRYVTRLGLSRRDFMGVGLKKIKLDYEKVRTQGYNTGHDDGYKQGHEVGFEKGKEVGYNNGDQQGYERGRREGIAEGILQGRYQGDKEGYARSLEEWRIWYFCPRCHEMLFVTPYSVIHNDIIGFLMSRGWGHYPTCPHYSLYW